MLTILHDPAGIVGATQHDLDYGISLQANIERHLQGGAGCELRINGVAVDPLTDPRMDAPPSVLDRVTVIRRPEGLTPVEWLFVAYAALAVAMVAMMPRPPDAQTQNESPNNKLTAQSNIARTYQAIPDVYGYRRIWPDLIQPSTIEYIDGLKYVTEWLCASRGKGTITDVQYAETPIGDIEGSSYEVFEPVPAGGYHEDGTTTLNDVFETFASDEVNGQELPYAVAWSTLSKSGDFAAVATESTFTVTIPDTADLANLKSSAPSGTAQVAFTYDSFGSPTEFNESCTVLSYLVSGGNVTFTFGRTTTWAANESDTFITFTIVPNGADTTVVGPFTLPIECSRLWWNVVFLRGLNATVGIKATWWQVDSGGVEIGGTRESNTTTYNDSTLDQRFYTKKVTPSAGTGIYRIQFERTTVEDGGAAGADVAKLEELYAVRYYATKTLPGVTVLRVTTKATLSATGFSDRKFNVRWLRHVRTLTTSTVSASRNFARTIAHIWTIAGNDIAGIDTDALAVINAEHGETSALLRFDGSLDDADMSLGERMQLVANMARCVIWRDGTKWTATRDQARAYPELQLDYRNLAAGGESGIGYAAHLPASNDGVEVEYVDEATQAKKSYIRLDINSGAPVAGASANPKKVKLIGCTTEAQATNRAYLEANRLLYQRISVTDTALSDGHALGIGSLVRWIDPNDFAGDDGLQAGEVLAIDGLTITTSERLDFKGETSGRILFTGANGQHLGAPIVCTPATAGATLASLPAGLYVADADRQLGSRYAFAVGLTEAEMEASGLYTVAEIKPAADGRVSLALVNYDERIYGAD